MRPMGPGGFNQRPAPYDRGDRFGGMNRYNNIGRGSRSFKGKSEQFWLLVFVYVKVSCPKSPLFFFFDSLFSAEAYLYKMVPMARIQIAPPLKYLKLCYLFWIWFQGHKFFNTYIH
jgi:hypothetical protein